MALAADAERRYASLAAALPAWCQSCLGQSPVLLVAPHGGRRPPIDALSPPPQLRVNDVYTPEVTRALARRLAAAVVINHGQDRNLLDLNRISQVRRRAPWFLELLVAQVDAIIAQHGHAEVVFVHGWNIGQPKCDIGIGAVETAAGLSTDGARLTVSEAYLAARVAVFRAACDAAGIEASIGARYPASHPNNLLQAFNAHSQTSEDAGVRRLATLAATAAVNAWQLELAIPLRWPGGWRDRLIEAVEAAFATGSHPGASGVGSPGGRARRVAASAPPSAPQPVGGAARQEAPGAPRLPSAALQFYDPLSDVGMFAGLGRVGAGTIGGRLLLFLGGQRVALFTGEDLGAGAARVWPLEFTAVERGAARLQFSGPMLLLDDGAVYLDLEAALAASRLVHAAVELSFTAALPRVTGIEFGVVEGRVMVGGEVRRVRTGGFANAGALRAAGATEQTMIAADFGGAGGLLARAVAGESGSMAVHFVNGTLESLTGARVTVSSDGDSYTPRSLELCCDDRLPLRGTVRSRMSILRPAGGGSYLRVAFGVARYIWGAVEGYGLYEHARPVAPRTTVNRATATRL